MSPSIVPLTPLAWPVQAAIRWGFDALVQWRLREEAESARSAPEHRRALRQAVGGWYLRERDRMDPATRRDFEAWLRAHPA